MKLSPSIISNAGDYKEAGLKYVSFTSLSVAIMALPFSIKICHTAIIVFLLSWFCEGGWYDKFLAIRQNTLLQLIIAFFLIEILGAFYTNDNSAWFEIEKKIFLLLVPVALATTSIKLSKKELHWIFYLFVLSCFAGSVICIGNAAYQMNLWADGLQPFTTIDYLDASNFKTLNPDESPRWLFFSYIALARGIGIHPTYFSLYIAFSIVFLLFQLHENSTTQKFISWILIWYFSFFIVFLSSRVMILSLLLILIIAMAQTILDNKTRITATIRLFTLICCFCFLLYFNPVSRYRNLQEIAETSFAIQSNHVYKNSTQIRASLWWLGVRSYTNVNPILGSGPGDVLDVMKTTSQKYNIRNSLNSYDPHNQFLFTLIGLGVVGLTLLMVLMIYSFYTGLVQKDYLFVTFIFLFCSLCITEAALELQKGIVFFALFFSLQAFSEKQMI